MITIKNIAENPNLEKTAEAGAFMVYEHRKDMSNDPMTAQAAFFMHSMNFRRRQLLCNTGISPVRLQAGAMQWISGNVQSETGLGTGASAVGSFLKGAVKGIVTGESAVKPLYTGMGYVMLEPTWKYIILEDVASWGPEGVVLDDGMFLACEASVAEKVVMRKNLSSVFGGEGLFNLSLKGSGIAALESNVPREELFEFNLENDVLKIDGNMAVAWSGSLEFTVERSSKSLIGSMVNGEGLVNVYRGTGRVLMAPTVAGTEMSQKNTPKEEKASKGILSTIAKVATS